MKLQFKGLKFNPQQVQQDLQNIRELKDKCKPSEFICIQSQQNNQVQLLDDQFLLDNNIQLQNYLEQPLKSFNIMKEINCQLTNNIEALNWRNPSYCQQFAIPPLLNKISTICVSPTGSGKTAAFLIPIILKTFNSIIISPTEELSYQTQQIFRNLSSNTNCDTALFVYIGDLDKLNMQVQFDYIVLDECDCLLEKYPKQMDIFLEKAMQSQPVLSLFSATMNQRIRGVIQSFVPNAAQIIINPLTPTTNVDHKFVYTAQQNLKLLSLVDLLTRTKPPVLIFTNQPEPLYQQLKLRCRKFQSAIIGDGQQNEEVMKIIEQFNDQGLHFVVTNQQRSRGIDFKNVNTVINFDVPSSIENYIHQVGRAGRQRRGVAITFLNNIDRFNQNLTKIVNNLETLNIKAEGWCDFAAKIEELNDIERQKREKKRSSLGGIGASENIDEEMYAEDDDLFDIKPQKIDKKKNKFKRGAKK